MSYRDDMKMYAEEMAKRKKTVLFAVKIVAPLLALALIATITFSVLDIINDNPSSATEEEESVSLIKPVAGTKVTVKQHSSPLYYDYVTVDEKYLSCELTVDSPSVKIDVPGKYFVIYKLIDAEGKTLDTFKLTVIVEEYDENMQELMTLVAKHAEKAGLTSDAVKDMTKEQIVRKIYEYVKDPAASANDANIYFSDVSNIPNIDRNNWKNDWVKEALLTLKMTNMKGDCYTYYSVSKAFFEYFEIENEGIKRGEGAASDGTHFWSIVNVGTEEAPKWYYYDATRLAGTFSTDGTKNSCLITLEKLESYVSSDGSEGFYHFNASDYPTAETTPLS